MVSYKSTRATSSTSFWCHYCSLWKAVNYFRKKVHLRYLTGFWIRLCPYRLDLISLQSLSVYFFLGCKCFIKDSPHYGMKTHTFRDHETSIGCIMCTQGQHATCVLNSDSQYWNTISWEGLFTNGRKKEDFAILNSVNGTYLKVQ